MCELERHVRWGISALILSLRRAAFSKMYAAICHMPTVNVSYEFTYVSVALIFWCFFPQELYDIVAKESAGVGVSHVAFTYSQ